MNILNELVELAKKVLSPKNAFAGVDAKFEWKAKANPTAILAIAEAFRDLEQRAEAAEAKLAEYEKQEPNHAQCCAEAGGDISICDCVNKDWVYLSTIDNHPAPAVSLVKLPKPYGMQDHEKWLNQDEVISAIREAGGEVQPADEAQTLDGKRIEFIQSLAEDPALLRGKSGLMRYKFDQHGFPVDGCIENATHYVARLIENGIVTHYAKSLYDFQEAIK